MRVQAGRRQARGREKRAPPSSAPAAAHRPAPALTLRRRRAFPWALVASTAVGVSHLRVRVGMSSSPWDARRPVPDPPPWSSEGGRPARGPGLLHAGSVFDMSFLPGTRRESRLDDSVSHGAVSFGPVRRARGPPPPPDALRSLGRLRHCGLPPCATRHPRSLSSAPPPCAVDAFWQSRYPPLPDPDCG